MADEKSDKEHSREVVNSAIDGVGKAILKGSTGLPDGMLDRALSHKNFINKKAADSIADNPMVQNLARHVTPDQAKALGGLGGSSLGGSSNLSDTEKKEKQGEKPFGGLRQRIFGDEDDGTQPEEDTIETSASEDVKSFARKILPIIGGSLPFIGMVAVVILVVSVSFLITSNVFYSAKEETDKVMNFLSGYGWDTSDKVFEKRLADSYNTFSRLHYKEQELDIALLSSTIHYDKMNIDEGKAGLFPFEQEDDKIKFYALATDDLGTMTRNDGLIGNLISKHYKAYCVPKDEDDHRKQFSDFFEDALTWGVQGVSDSAKTKNILKILWLEGARVSEDGFSFTSWLNRIFAMFRSDMRDLENLSNLFDFEEVTSETCGSDERLTYSYTYFNDYDKYKDYLRTYYVKERFVTCPNCLYHDADKETQDKIIERTINEIFTKKDFDNTLLGILSGSGESSGITSEGPPLIGNYKAMRCTVEPSILSGVESPIDKPNLNISANFDYYNPFGTSKFHYANDINNPRGDNVISIADGVVRSTQNGCSENICSDKVEYATYVILRHQIDGRTFESRYWHMACNDSAHPRVGETVKKGQVIGHIASTGCSTGAHLHFEFLEVINENGVEKLIRYNPTQIVQKGKKVTGETTSSACKGKS